MLVITFVSSAFFSLVFNLCNELQYGIVELLRFLTRKQREKHAAAREAYKRARILVFEVVELGVFAVFNRAFDDAGWEFADKS